MTDHSSSAEGQSKSYAENGGAKSTDQKEASLSQVPRLLFNKRWWWTTLLVIAAMVIMARLGVWQLGRLNQRKDANTLLLEQLNAPPVELSRSTRPTDFDGMVDRLASVEGILDYPNEIILTQQSYQGRPGVHLVTPLIIEGTDEAILIDRGWVPAREIDMGDLSRYEENGLVKVEGVILESESIIDEQRDASDYKREWYRVDIDAIENQLPYRLLPIYLKWLPQDLDQLPPIRPEREIDLSQGSHLSYAIQWFLFTLVLGIGYIAFILRSERK